MKKLLTAILLFFLFAMGRMEADDGPKWSLGTNLVDWADLGTVNLEVGIPLARHFSLVAGARYNPWQFKKTSPDYITQDRKINVYAGARYWPWYIQSGFWVEGRAQYTKFDISGIWRPALESGQAVGLGCSAGYSVMIAKHLNLDLGIGFWGGYAFDYTLYHCPYCAMVREQGPRWFIFPDNIKVSFVYIF